MTKQELIAAIESLIEVQTENKSMIQNDMHDQYCDGKIEAYNICLGLLEQLEA